MNEYIVTFGQQYPRERHPKVDYAHHDGWLTIIAEDYATARNKAFDELGPHFSSVYPAQDVKKEYYPLGELKRI